MTEPVMFMARSPDSGVVRGQPHGPTQAHQRATVMAMRIALVVPGGVGPDGVQAVIPALLSLLERLAVRHEVLVLATEQRAQPSAYELRGARVLALGEAGRLPLRRLRLARRAATAIGAFRPDVVHAIWLGLGSSIGVVSGWRLGVPVVVSIGGGELVDIPRIRYGGARSLRGRFHSGLALRRAAAVTAGSRTALEPLARRRLDARWIPLGVERVADTDVSIPTRTGGDPLRLLVVASVNRVKGPEVVLGAVLRAKTLLGGGVRLDWIGEDTLRGSSATLASALGIADVVTFRGFRPHDQVLAAWRRADIAVQGSHHESQGVAVLEAAMAGVPTVGTAVGLVAELAALDPPAAVAVPVGDPRALAGAIVELAGDEDRRRHLGGAARAWALAHDAGWTAAAFETLYAEVVRR
jgi:glycosyltransferase involved in cell wall biosynthesis